MASKNRNVARQQEINGVTRARIIQQAAYSGPLPPAEEFAKYDNACPGAADRILKMAEQQSLHRQGVEKGVVAISGRNSFAGIIAATFLSLVILASGTYCILHDHDWAGVSLVTIDLVSLVGVFIYGTNQKKK